ncbi:peptidase, partial [Rhodospirillum rubrum]|nr:peptidase [Rhodospirillum rubrum]
FWWVWGGVLLLSVLPLRRRSFLSPYLGLAGGACLLAVGLHVRAWLGAGSWSSLAVDLTLLLCGALFCRLSWGLARSSAPHPPLPGRIGDQNA